MADRQSPEVKAYLAAVEDDRREMLRRVGTPMWQRMGWKPRHWLGSRPVDPIEEAREFARAEALDGIVMVPVTLLKALAERKECSARRDFYQDEDGPHSWTTHAVCRKAEGHEGRHSNGYHAWEDRT